jgi:hypothetical protein
MQEKNERADARESRRETRFFLAMAKTGPYIDLVFMRGGNFSVVKRGARRAAGDVR